MWIYLIVFCSQLTFNIFKVLEIKYTYEKKVKSLLINSVLINLVSLLGVYYSLDALMNDDFLVIIFYLLGSVLGKYIGMKWDNPLFILWDRILKKAN